MPPQINQWNGSNQGSLERPKPHEFYRERFWQKWDERSMVTEAGWTCICRAERIWWMIDCLWLPRSGMFSSKTVSHGKWAKVRQLVTGKRDQRESALVKRSPALGHRAACLETGFVIVFMVTINCHYCHWHIRHSERNWGKKSESYMIRFSFEDCWPNSGGSNSGTIDYLTSVNKLWVVANRIIGIWCWMMIINKNNINSAGMNPLLWNVRSNKYNCLIRRNTHVLVREER